MPFERVAHLAGRAAREHVSIRDTPTTVWFLCSAGVARGEAVCGVLWQGTRARLKGMWVPPEYRGHGCGSGMIDDMIAYAIAEGATELNCISVNPPFFDARGWERLKEIRPGSWRMRKVLDGGD